MSFDSRNPAVALIMHSLRQEWLAQVVFCIFLTLATGVLVYFGFLLTAAFVFALALLTAWRVIPRKHRAYYRLRKMLHERAGEVVWIYAMITEQSPFGIRLNRTCTLYFKLLNRDQMSVSIPPDRLDHVQHHLSGLLPHASIGYSKDREQWYLVDPALLLKGNTP